MIKRLYLANGKLVSPLSASADDIAVDTSIAALFQSKLNIGDHCYLKLSQGDKLEIIKVRRDYSGFRVDRAQDGTQRQGFSTNANITYTLTQSEILDATTDVGWNIYASGYGVATVEGGGGNWVVGLETIQANTLGGIETRTDNNVLVISDKSGMFGCCDGGVIGAPSIPGPYFYLTSMLYPQEAIEVMTPQPKDRNGNAIPPINFNIPWWLLVQPSMVEQYMGRGVSVLDWLNYGSEKTFTAPPEKYIKTDVGVGLYGDWQKFGGEKEFTVESNNYMSRDCYPLEMLLFGGEIIYDKALDAYLLTAMSVLDWVLEDG